MKRNVYKKVDEILTLDPITSDKDRFSASYTITKALYAIAIETDNELARLKQELIDELRNKIGKEHQ